VKKYKVKSKMHQNLSWVDSVIINKCLEIGKRDKRDEHEIYSWTLSHSKGVIIVYKNLTSDLQLNEKLNFENENLEITEPKNHYGFTELNVHVKPK